MESIFERSELLLGKGASDILSTKKVAVIGVGGVGGYVVEGLTRSGVGSFFLLDSDKVNPSNINRQIIALHSNVGKYKTHVLKERRRTAGGEALYNPTMPHWHCWGL